MIKVLIVDDEERANVEAQQTNIDKDNERES